MKRTILFSLFALLLVPALAVAETQTPAPAATQECGPSLDVLGAAPIMSAAVDLAAVSPWTNAQQIGRGCCKGRRLACEAICAACGGVFEFNCDPATCQASCICSICP